MQHFKKIKQMQDRKTEKVYAITTMCRNPEDSSKLKYSILQKNNSAQEEKSTFFLRNLDDNKIQYINNEHQVDKVLSGVNTLPQIQKIIDKVWNNYLNEVERQEQNFLQACHQGEISIIVKVLNNKSQHPINPGKVFTIDGQNGIHLATLNGSYRNIQIISLLKDYGVDINGKTTLQQRTPLMLGSIRGNHLAVQTLLKLGADHSLQDFQGNTALHHACLFDQEQIVDLLLKYGVSLMIKNKKQMTCLQCISNPKIYELINEKMDNYDTSYSRTLLKEADIVLANSRQDHIERLLHKLQINSQMTSESRETQQSLNLQQKKKKNKSKSQHRRERIKQIMIKQIKQISLSSFKKVSLLGKGAFGEVYLVENTLNGQKYAMKALDKTMIMKQNILRYAMTERKILSTINHPFVVKLHYAFQTMEKLYLVMDYCPGGDLAKLLRKKGTISQNILINYICEIILAIQALHKAQIIYRDLKPGNIILDNQGHACLTDFGLSKQASLSHSFCGSTAYLAPQMLWRRGHTKVMDWYLLGVLIYECLTGKPPFWDTNRQQLLNNIKSGRYKPLGKEFSAQIVNLVEQLLKPNTNKRLGIRGAGQIKSHAWFKKKGINWKDVQDRKLIMQKTQAIGGKAVKEQMLKQEKEQNYIQGWDFKKSKP